MFNNLKDSETMDIVKMTDREKTLVLIKVKIQIKWTVSEEFISCFI